MISPSFPSIHLQRRCFQIRSRPETPRGHEFGGTPFNPLQPPKVSCAQLPILCFHGYPWLLGFWDSMNQPSLWLHKLQDSWLSGKEFPASAGDVGSIPASGRSPGEGNANPRQYSCLGNPMDRGAWWAIAHGVVNSQT